jgi:hypothetical protein
MAWRAARTSVLLILALSGAAVSGARGARAEEAPVGAPPAVPVEVPPAVQAAAPPATLAEAPPATLAEAPATTLAEAQLPPWRPRFSLAVGFGATFDATGFPDGTHLLPAFFGVGGFGDGLWGFDLGAFASSASGRFDTPEQLSVDAPVDRLALDAFGVVRPAARVRRDDWRYGYRVLHTLAAELGLGLERDGRSMVAGSRFEVHTGARVEFPLTPAGQPSELRLRLAVRHAIGLYTPEVAVSATGTAATAVGDSTELYAALAVVF